MPFFYVFREGKMNVAVATLFGTQSRGLLPWQCCLGLSPGARCRGNAARDSVPGPVAVAMLLGTQSQGLLPWQCCSGLSPEVRCRGNAAFLTRFAAQFTHFLSKANLALSIFSNYFNCTLKVSSAPSGVKSFRT